MDRSYCYSNLFDSFSALVVSDKKCSNKISFIVKLRLKKKNKVHETNYNSYILLIFMKFMLEIRIHILVYLKKWL